MQQVFSRDRSFRTNTNRSRIVEPINLVLTHLAYLFLKNSAYHSRRVTSDKVFDGGITRTRTWDKSVNSRLLYQLSYDAILLVGEVGIEPTTRDL